MSTLEAKIDSPRVDHPDDTWDFALRKLRAKIAQGWCQYARARTRLYDGSYRECGASAPEASRWCLMGAIQAIGFERYERKILDALGFPHHPIDSWRQATAAVSFNNHYEMTQEKMLAFLDSKIAP